MTSTSKENLLNDEYTLPNSTFYTNLVYHPITVKLDEVLGVYKDAHQLIIIKPSNQTIIIRYSNEFEVDFIVADLTNRLIEYRTQSV